MRHGFLSLLCALCVLGGCTTPTSFAPPSITSRVRDVTVYVANKYELIGSGVIVKNPHGIYVWTCAHIIVKQKEDLFVVRSSNISPNDPEMYSKVEVVGMDAGLDVALLRVISPTFKVPVSVRFVDKMEMVPESGVDIYHCGAPLRVTGTVTHGFMKSFDEQSQMLVTSCPVDYGSSGGGMFLEDGRCVGILVHKLESPYWGIGPGSPCLGSNAVSLVTIRAWAKKKGFEHLLPE